MLRSRSLTDVDKAYYLWTLCTLVWCQENNEPPSWNNIERLFGEHGRRIFNMYREFAIDAKDIQEDSITLTPKGMRIVNNWRQFRAKIYGDI